MPTRKQGMSFFVAAVPFPVWMCQVRQCCVLRIDYTSLPYAKGGLSPCKRPPFAMQYATFYDTICRLLQGRLPPGCNPLGVRQIREGKKNGRALLRSTPIRVVIFGGYDTCLFHGNENILARNVVEEYVVCAGRYLHVVAAVGYAVVGLADVVGTSPPFVAAAELDLSV